MDQNYFLHYECRESGVCRVKGCLTSAQVIDGVACENMGCIPGFFIFFLHLLHVAAKTLALFYIHMYIYIGLIMLPQNLAPMQHQFSLKMSYKKIYSDTWNARVVTTIINLLTFC